MRMLLLSAMFIMIGALSVNAATHDVSIVGFTFDPQIVNINVGDTVKWTNNDSVPHTSTSDTMVWDSGTLNNGDTFEFTFNTADSYPYHCEVHPSMTGTVNVGSTGIESASLGELKATFAGK